MIRKLLLITAIFKTGLIFSQLQPNTFNVGVEGGPGLSMLYGPNALVSKKPVLSGCAGLSAQYNVNSFFSVRIGAGYIRHGSQTTYSIPSVNGLPPFSVDATTKMDYMVFPVLGRFTYGHKVQFFFDAGAYFGALVKAELKTGQIFIIPSITVDYAQYMHKFDVGVCAGPGLNIPIKDRFNVSAEARFNVGLYNTDNGTVGSTGALHNFAATLMLGFEYTFGKKTTTYKAPKKKGVVDKNPPVPNEQRY